MTSTEHVFINKNVLRAVISLFLESTDDFMSADIIGHIRTSGEE